MSRRRLDLPELRSLQPEPGLPTSLCDPPTVWVDHPGMHLVSGDTMLLHGPAVGGGSALVGPFAQAMRVKLVGGSVTLSPIPETNVRLTVAGSLTSSNDLAERMRKTVRSMTKRPFS